MALVAAVMTKARGGRFDSHGRPCRLVRQSPTLNVLGTLALWTGWFFFNASGVRSFSDQPDSVSLSLRRLTAVGWSLVQVPTIGSFFVVAVAGVSTVQRQTSDVEPTLSPPYH